MAVTIVNSIRVWNGLILSVDKDPSTDGGIAAGSNSLAFGPTGLVYRKTGPANTSWTSIANPIASAGLPNGLATLDAGGKVPVTQLPNSVMEYQGAWNAATNSPTLADGTGNAGDVYRVSVAGTQNLGSGSQSFLIGDFIIYSGSIWEKSPAADGVTSVNGLQGAVTVNAINQLTGDVTAGPASGSASATAAVASVGGSSASNVNAATVLANAATSANTPSAIVKRDGSGNFSAGTITANLTGNASGSAASFTGSLIGDVTGTQGATVVSTVGGSTASNVNAATVLANAATSSNTASTIVKRDASGNFSAGVITASLTGNVTGNASGSSASFTGALVGDVTGTQGATVVSSVGGSTAANVNAATVLANAATSANTASAIVKRDGSGNFSAGTITANLTGNASGSSASFTGSLVGDVTGTQGATVVSTVGGSSAANVNAATILANAATSANTANAIVKRDGSGGFSAGAISGASISLTGAASASNLSGTNTGDQTITLTGDVTGSGTGSFAATIAANAVTNAKAAQMPTLTLKGNNTGGTANALDLTVSQVNTMLGTLANPMTTGGDIIYGGASGVPTRLANGTVNQVLTSSGTTVAPTWASVAPPLNYQHTSAQTTVSSANDSKWIAHATSITTPNVTGSLWKLSGSIYFNGQNIAVQFNSLQAQWSSADGAGTAQGSPPAAITPTFGNTFVRIDQALASNNFNNIITMPEIVVGPNVTVFLTPNPSWGGVFTVIDNTQIIAIRIQ